MQPNSQMENGRFCIKFGGVGLCLECSVTTLAIVPAYAFVWNKAVVNEKKDKGQTLSTKKHSSIRRNGTY